VDKVSDEITLTRRELVSLTGLSQPKRMAEWLRERQWVFEELHGRDIPKVDRTYYLNRMSGQLAGATANPKREEPHLDIFNRGQK
jgi:hypothetical protein